MKDLTILVLYVVTSNMYLSVHSKSDWIFTDGGNGRFLPFGGHHLTCIDTMFLSQKINLSSIHNDIIHPQC